MLKDSNITIRMSAVHKKAIREQAMKLGLSVGSYLLMLALYDIKTNSING